MAGISGERFATITPTAADSRVAVESSRQLARFVASKRKGPFRLRIEPDGAREETVSIPASAFRLLADILAEMAKGNAVTLTPVHSELTTQQAAELLNVSRPFVIEQMERGRIPFRKVGSHRRVLFQDLMAFKQSIDQKRLQALEQLSELDQQLGLGYER